VAKKIPFHSLVTPKNPGEGWEIGKVIGMSRFDLSIGPLLRIRDIVTKEIVESFPMFVDRLVRAS